MTMLQVALIFNWKTMEKHLHQKTVEKNDSFGTFESAWPPASQRIVWQFVHLLSFIVGCFKVTWGARWYVEWEFHLRRIHPKVNSLYLSGFRTEHNSWLFVSPHNNEISQKRPSDPVQLSFDPIRNWPTWSTQWPKPGRVVCVIGIVVHLMLCLVICIWEPCPRLLNPTASTQ